ncbi:MAG: M60 family metallopeptidase [Bacteroides sp.]|nr:M60 family metallopeptidase [Bacteroides sp.]MCM1448681.1 M60 family metallopeptidase [Bacteroides sp.]
MKKTFLLSLLGIIMSLTAMAQLPQSGKYYRIVNQNPDKSVTSNGKRYGFAITEDLTSNALKATEQGGNTQYNQLWRLVGSKLQNAHTQRYFNTLPGSSIGYTSTTGATVSFEEIENGYVIICGQPAHADASNSIVGWYDKSNPSSCWKFEEVAVDAQALKNAQNEYKLQMAEKAALQEIVNKAATITPVVEGYFADKACTTLKSEYAGMTEDEFKARMTEDELPEQIQNMVMSIKNKWKDEFNPTLSERFRVQNYKIYTRCDDAGAYDASPKNKWVATQMSDRNNPTGIWTDALQLICVFVENEIPEGASLKIGQASGAGVIGLFDSDRNNVELHQGMNIVYCGLNYSTQWIMYTCAADYTKPLSTYPEIKIHIEGGDVLGYVTKKADDEEATNAEYEEVFGNAVKLMKSKDADPNAINFSVKGERGLFEFPVECYDQIWSNRTSYGYKIYKSINFYDNVLKWEWSTMGWQDRVENGEADNELENIAPGGGDAVYPTYVNNLAPTMMASSDKNPYSGNSHTGMPGIWSVESTYNAERANFDTWCCGHESGHNNQHTINLPSSMESSNNYFSNIINTLYGYRMSRGWSFSENYDKYVAQKIIFPHRDISITLRMYYNLWLYYHQAGKNKQFSPRLFKLLRADRMNFGGEGWHAGTFGGANKGNAVNSWLKFYEKVCEAAGEDLTEYFRMWGFLTPTSEAGGNNIEKIGNKYYAYCGDYSSYYINCEQADIDAAIARVKSKGYPENLQIIFIEDRQILRKRHDPWATGNSYKPNNSGSMRTQEQLYEEYGNVGDVLTFIDGSANTSEYTYILSGNKISLKGKGGVGFIVYDKDGNNVYMSNKYEFEIPASVASAGFTIKAINADGTSSEVTDNADNATPAEKLEILQNALALAAKYTALEDATNKKVGFYSSEEIAMLKGLVEDADRAIANKDVDNYLALSNSINSEVLRLQAEDPTLKIVPNALYTIGSVRKISGGTRYLGTNGNNIVGAANANNNYYKWAFVPANDKNDGTYYLQNRNNNKLMCATLNEKGKVSGISMTEETPAAIAQTKIVALGNGVFALRPKDETHVNIDPSGNITVWGSADEGSQWNITLVEEFEEVTDEMMNERINLAKDLINDVCDYSLAQNKYTLQVEDAAQNGYLSTNQPGASTYPLSNAIDGRTTSFFMSNRDNNTGTTEPHHLKVDLGKGVTTKSLQFYIYGNRNFNYAQTINVYGSTGGSSWTKVATVNCSSLAYTSNVLKPSVAYRFWRFDVVGTAGKYADSSDFPWFTANEFEVYDVEEIVEFKPGFEGIVQSFVTSLVKRSDDAKSQMERSFRTMLGDYIAYTQLKSSYDLLYNKAAAIDPTVGIDGIEADDEVNGNEIYDLSGRRLDKVNGHGVYIIGGKKVIR